MIGAAIAGRFVIEREAASGGMGTVYRARDLVSGTPVAIKLLAAASDRDVERFTREADILAGLDHPHIVRYVAHGVAADRRYLAMDWLEGQHLAERVEERPLAVAEAVALLRNAAAALGLAHGKGIVHRDIKPENLFLPGGDVARLKVLDFGIAHLGAGARRLTQTGALMGTPGYLAPEIIRGAREIDARADVFALGCVAFFSLAGRPAFEGDDIGATFAKILVGDVPRLADVAPGVPALLCELVAEMMARDPQARPSDGAAVGARLAALAELGGAAGSAVRPRALGITRREQRIACHVVAHAAPAIAAEVARALGPVGVELHALADGTLVLTAGAAKPHDQAGLAARAALALAAADPAARVAVYARVGSLSSAASLDPVATAAWLGRAAAGRIAVEDVAAALLDGPFEIERDAGGAFLRARRQAPDARRRLLGKETPFVGRARELGLLTSTFTTAVEEQVGSAVVVTGPPGSGKSRLRQELVDWIRARPEPVEVLLGAGDPLAGASPFAVLGQALRKGAGIDDGDGVEERRRKFAARLGRSLAETERSRVVCFLGELAGVPFSEADEPLLRAARGNPQLMSDGMRRAWEDWLTVECSAQPMLLVLEDLHHGDAGTVAFVELALRHQKDAPFFVVALGRPELETAFRDLWKGREVQSIRLGPLSRKAMESLVRDALGASVSKERLAALAERAEGNPFVLEELIRAAHAGRTEGLPESVLGMVQARLDAEGPVAKRVLRAASVFGDRFSRAGVRALLGGAEGGEIESGGELGECLDRLVTREILARASTPEAGRAAEVVAEEVLSFGHGIVREAAYATLTPEDRVLGHRLAGRHLEAVPFCDPMVVAEHLRRGCEPGRAVRWYDRAATHALAANQLTAAIQRADLGLEALLEAQADSGGAGRAAQGDREPSSEAALGPSGTEPATAAAGALLLILAEARVWRGEHQRGAESARAALASLAPGGRPWLRALTQVIIAAGKQGKPEEVEGAVTEATAAPIGPEDRDALLSCLGFGAMFLMFGGRFAAAEPLLALVDDLAGDGTDVEPQALALVHQARAVQASAKGDLGACLDDLEASLAAFEKAGDLRNASTARANLGFVYAELGDAAGAERQLREALGAAERMGLDDVAACVLHNLGRVVGLGGDLPEAERIERRAMEHLEKQGEARLLGLARVYLAEILTATGRPAEAVSEAERAVEALGVAAPALQARALATLAQARGAGGAIPEALADARKAQAALDALGGLEEGEAEIRLCHAECLAAAGAASEARAAIVAARMRLEERAGRIASDDWRRRFLHDVPANARTLQLAATWAAAEAPDLLRDVA